MDDFTNSQKIQIYDFKIRSSQLRHPSRLTLKLSVDGIDRKELLSVQGNIEDGIWEVYGDMKMGYGDQFVTVVVLTCTEGSTKKLGDVTVRYSELLAHLETQSKETYQFTLNGSISSDPIFITCSIGSLPQSISPNPLSSSANNTSNEGRSGNNQASAPNHFPALSIADLERDYAQVVGLSLEHSSHRLDTIGRAYAAMYEKTYEMAHLERAISILDQALQNVKFHPEIPEYLNNLARCLLLRSERTGSYDDIEHAVLKSREAVHTAETSDRNMHNYLVYHALALLKRFKYLGKLEDLQSSISFMEKALRLMPDGHTDKPVCLNSLGNAIEKRFERLGHIEDLETAITYKQNAVDLTPDGHPDKPGRLNNLGTAFETRFDRLGHVKDLEDAIFHRQNAVNLTPDGDPDKPGHFNNLGNAFQTRFYLSGDIKDLETAISHKQNALNLTSDGHPAKPGRLSNLGNAFVTRFNWLGHVEDLEKAILHKQTAVNLTSDGHPDKPVLLNTLGSVFQVRFGRLGHVEDLETAILHKQNAVNLTPDGHPTKPKYLTNLGIAFETRFDRLGHIKDLETAITYKKTAVNLMPDDHPDKPAHLISIGNAFETRFDQLGQVKDIETAIVHKQNAVNLTPDGHPDKPGYLSDLGNAFEARFNRLNHLEDLETAIIHQTNAVELIPDGHPEKLGCLNNLGNVLNIRFDRLGRAEDIEAAILYKQKVVDLTPDASSEKPQRLDALGHAFMSRLKIQMQPKDAYAALLQYSTAASLPTGSPRVRLRAASNWALVSDILEILGEPISSPLEPYHIAIDLLPRVAWLGIPITTQHTLLEEVGGLVREAISAAIKVGEYETAVAWVEAGRSIAWQNLLNLRTPVNELRSVHPGLANRLEMISRQLDMSVRESNVEMVVATDSMEVTHSPVQLALDWDDTVKEIRSKPGFDSFLKPKSLDQLAHITNDGPVVILTITEDRCDALLIIPKDNGGTHVSSISLNAFSFEKGESLLKELKGLLSYKHLRARNSRKPRRRPINAGNGPSLENILRRLWINIVKPIVEALRYQPRTTDLPHIWWCATGPLAFLPIHAAGLYDTEIPGNKLSDYVVSSYIPTLSALLDDSTPSQEDFRLLAIAQANAPGVSSIPKTEVEVKHIQALAKSINLTTMMKEDATIENVWQEMERSSWVHLACHGQQNVKEPMKSGLLLHDGTLGLQRLIAKPLPHADFAFLSACQTATGDEKIAEESLHLAAGMLFAGYKGVIATMWSIMDDIGPRVAEDVYRVMLKDGKPNRKAAAHALHEAVRRLREDPKVDMLYWVPFIHIGR